jgi:hypothetical protein
MASDVAAPAVSRATRAEAVDTGAVSSIARGLARNAAIYKGRLAACDPPRHSDLDGRDHDIRLNPRPAATAQTAAGVVALGVVRDGTYPDSRPRRLRSPHI